MAAILMCDRCGNIYKEGKLKTKVTISMSTGDEDDWVYNRERSYDYDVCTDCTKILVEEFTGAVKVLEARVKL